MDLKWFVFHLVEATEPVDEDGEINGFKDCRLFAARSISEATELARESCRFFNRHCSEITSDGVPTRTLYRGVRRRHLLGADGGPPRPEGQVVSSNRMRFRSMDDVDRFLDMEPVRVEYPEVKGDEKGGQVT